MQYTCIRDIATCIHTVCCPFDFYFTKNLLEPMCKQGAEGEASKVFEVSDVGSHVVPPVFTTQLNKACCVLSLHTNSCIGSHKGVFGPPSYFYCTPTATVITRRDLILHDDDTVLGQQGASFWQTSTDVRERA